MSVGRLERLGGWLAVGADDDLLDLLFRRLQLGLAMAPQQGAAAIEGDRFLKVDAAAFQLGDDFVHSLQRGLEPRRRNLGRNRLRRPFGRSLRLRHAASVSQSTSKGTTYELN